MAVVQNFDETASFLQNSVFFCILGVFGGLFDFFGDLKWVKFRIFLILLDPGCPGDRMVGPHTDCVASWDIAGGIRALGCPQGPVQTGFGVAQDGPVAVLAALQANLAGKG